MDRSSDSSETRVGVSYTGVDTFAYTEWRIERRGETVMWGKGTLFIDHPSLFNHGYTLHIHDDAVTWDEVENEFYVLVTDAEEPPHTGENYCGFAIGAVDHKMVPEHSPDISATRLYPNDDV